MKQTYGFLSTESCRYFSLTIATSYFYDLPYSFKSIELEDHNVCSL